jgi:hypothetical protein
VATDFSFFILCVFHFKRFWLAIIELLVPVLVGRTARNKK